MNTDPEPPLSELWPLPKHWKFRTRKIGAQPVSPLYPVAVARDNGNSIPQSEFRIDWEDRELGITVQVREREDGHLIAEVRCTYADLIETSAVSVGLFGSAGEYAIRKSILLNVTGNDGRRGSADFGLLTDLVKELGPNLGVVVFLLV